jgi:hypothetical protein
MSLRPETFEDEMERRLGKDYRLRWSPRKETWQIEQKIARGHVSLPRKFQWTDDYIRLRDGYALVAEVSPKLVMKCLQCRAHLKVPELKWGEIKCESCRATKNYNTAVYYVAYFPLCERLLQHLEKTSPLKGWEWVKRMQIENARKKDLLDRQLESHLDDAAMEVRNVVGEIPRVGYGSGPTKFGRI